MSKNISDYTPKEFVHIYKSLLHSWRKCALEKNSKIAQAKLQAIQKISSEKDEQKRIKQQYFIGKFDSASLYLDRITNGKTIYFDDAYTITPLMQKRQIVSGYYKNGKPRYKTISYSILRFSSGANSIDVAAGRTLTDARELKRDIENKIIAGRELKAQLDAQLSKCEERIKDIKADSDKQTNEILASSDEKEKRYEAALKKLLDGGGKQQIKRLFLPSRMVLMTISVIIGLPILFAALGTYSNIIKANQERSVDYVIDAPDELNFDCDLEYNQDNHYFYCSQKSYSGTFSRTDNSELLSDGVNYGLTTQDASFEKKLSLVVITPDVWAVENLSFNDTAEKFKNSTDTLEIYNSFINEIVAQKTVKVVWNFSDEDKALMKDVWSNWRIEQEEKARARLDEEIRAEEEARIKAEEEARIKAEEEARIKTEEEARIKAEEEARIKAEEESNTQAPATTQPSAGSNSSGSSSSNSGTRYGAVCNDGTSSTSTGRGACSRHGGVSYWLTR